MDKRILVIGGSGMLGEPVARQLKEDGFTARILSRNIEKTQALFGEEFEVVKGDVGDEESLKTAMEDCFGVHINLNGGPLPRDYDRVFHLGTKQIVKAAKEMKIQRLTIITGTSVFPQNGWFYQTEAKLKAEEAIIDSGINYFIFCPTWFYESLHFFIRNGKATVVGKQENPWHWLAAADYAKMVSKSYKLGDNLNKRLFIIGPKPMTLKVALQNYCHIARPEIKVSSVPTWLISMIATLTGKPQMKDMAKMMSYFEKVPEGGDPGEANNLLGAPITTLKKWIDTKYK